MSMGWVKLHRKFSEWEWYQDSKMVHLFIHLLINANHEDNKWRGIEIKRGQMISGRKSLSEETGISEQSIRTCMNRLKSTNEITSKTTNKFSIITICNYDKYQAILNEFNQQNNQQPNQQSTNNQPTTNQQSTTNKNNKNNKKKKKLRSKEEEQINLPWSDERFIQVWDFWKKYKKEQFRFNYKQIGEQGALNHLFELSSGKIENAMLIIKQSIENGWAGLFELKGKYQKMVNDYDMDLINELLKN